MTRNNKPKPTTKRTRKSNNNFPMIRTNGNNNVGRPSKYQPDFCDRIIHMMRQGMSRHEVAYILNIHYVTLLDWEKKIPEFSYALKIGEDFSRGWWESQGRINLQNDRFNNTLYMMNMQNRFAWTRRIDGKITSENINTERRELTITFSYDRDDVKQIIAELVRIGIDPTKSITAEANQIH